MYPNKSIRIIRTIVTLQSLVKIRNDCSQTGVIFNSNFERENDTLKYRRIRLITLRQRERPRLPDSLTD